MPEATPTPTLPQNVQALQYLFDVARQAPVPANVHDQTKTYAQQILGALTKGDQDATALAGVAASKAAEVSPVAAAVEAAKAEVPATPAA